MDSVKSKIVHYLSTHAYLRLATVSEQNTPVVHTVAYVSAGDVVFFTTDRESRKAQNILRNPAVAYSVDENYHRITDIQGVQMEGKATLLTEPDQVRMATRMMIEKFPVMKDLPKNPALVFFKIEPTVGYFIDCTVEFGNRDRVTY
jgi:nitroimidazol reductase NimA-like FMN-containing flavoprotein (pyridoxamine 5'-phosphate oxidase superfamily)